MHAVVRQGNISLESGDTAAALEAAAQVRAMLAVLGVDPLDEHWCRTDTDNTAAHEALDVLVRAELERRQQARKDKDWAIADEVRDRLNIAGVEVTDTPNGPEWSLKSGR